MAMPTTEKMFQLWLLFQLFIENNNITCAEAVYQTDTAGEDALELIENACNIVGYVEGDDDDTD